MTFANFILSFIVGACIGAFVRITITAEHAWIAMGLLVILGIVTFILDRHWRDYGTGAKVVDRGAAARHN